MPSADATDMARLGIVQRPHPILTTPTRPFELPEERDEAQRIFTLLEKTADAVFAIHPSAKGLGVAAPQIGIGRRIALVRPWQDDTTLCLLNAEVFDTSAKTDLRYEGCLSLFDYRGRVSRPLTVTIRLQNFEGSVRQETFCDGAARLVCHELDHLDGCLYCDRINEPLITAEQYREMPDTDWHYE